MSAPTKRVLLLTTSAHLNCGAGGRTRIVSEYRCSISGLYPVVILCLVPPRQWRRPINLWRARRLLQRDASCPVLYWPCLPSFGCRWLHQINARIHAAVVLLFSLALRVGGIHGHGQAAAAVAIKARELGLKAWVLFDVHGSSPEEYAFASSSPNPRWIAGLEREERASLSCADEVVCVSHAMARHYRAKYSLDSSRWSVVPCATNSAAGWDPQQRSRVRRELNIENRFVFVYAGSYRKYQMADQMVALFGDIKRALPETYFLILTSDQDRFSTAATQGGLLTQDYRILSLSHQEVLETLPAADVGFLLRADSAVNRVSSPTKFAEYCICGVPTLLTPYVGDYSRAVEEAQLGCCLQELRVSAKLLGFLRDVQGHREEFAVRCQHYASQHLTWASAGPTLRAAYDRLSSAPAGVGRSKTSARHKTTCPAE